MSIAVMFQLLSGTRTCRIRLHKSTYGGSLHVNTCEKPQDLTAFSSSRAVALILYDPVGAITASWSDMWATGVVD